jgi:hypothetical protein
MIVVKLQGGLGNQMFQYACAKMLATKYEISLKVDLDFLLDRTPRENFVFRNYDLDIFILNPPIISVEEKTKLLRKPSNLLQRFIKPNYITFVEKQFNFDEKVMNLGPNTYLDGYFQSEKYFASIKDEIKKEFTFRNKFSELEKSLYDEIKSKNAICVNFRRADYVNLQVSADMHGIVEMEFYHHAINEIATKVDNPTFYVFSDEITWCQQNFSIDYPCTFVDYRYKGEKFASYFQLMIACKHFIIPNSTFAWWAAWLSESNETIVITPRKWFANEVMQAQAIDIIPDRWIKM